MSTHTIYDKVTEVIQACPDTPSFKSHLDIGSGRGELIGILQDKFGFESKAVDYTDEMMQREGQTVDIVDLNESGLPYDDATFDVVTATEVIEHLEHGRKLLREISRVTKPGGLVVITTPNILNLNSRLRFLWFGFWNLFGPLPVKHSALYSTGGHINPISVFYISHGLMDANFEGIESTVDKYQRSAIPKLILLWPLIKLFSLRIWSREVKRFKTIDEDNAPLVRVMNTVPLLLGRTVIVSARKPKQ
ncbi:MAG: class I SAM-dependent methyltransferase [Limisphaerales bacterium]